MKIGEAKPQYYANRSQLVDQLRELSKRKEAAEAKFRITGEKSFSDEAASFELSIDATNKAFEENQRVLDSLVEQEVAIANMETSRQQGDAMKEETIEVPIQVNGKVRGTVSVAATASKEEVLAAAKEVVKDRMTGNLVKEIYVPGKIVNLVVK